MRPRLASGCYPQGVVTEDSERTRIEQLAEKAALGDRAAAEELLEHYLPRLRAFVRLRAGPLIRRHESNADIVQSVCREVLQHVDRFQHPSESAFRRWLFTTALRKLSNRRDFYMAEKRDVLRNAREDDTERNRELLECYSSFSTPSGHVAVQEEIARVEEAMESLSEEHREVITLAHLVGLSRAEIAEQMGRSEGAVRHLLHRALAQLGVRLGVPK
jgi:RNA polymerase sigma-70 factor (ECF subfamily)